MDMSVIVNPIIILFIAIFIGYIAVKTGYLKAEIRKVISTILVKITLPLLILTSLLDKDISSDTIGNVALAAGTAVIVTILLGALGFGTARLFGLREPTKSVHAVLSGGGNVGFLGYPIIFAVFGEEALFYAVIYGTVNDAIFWTLGVYFINRAGGKLVGKDAIKKLLNPSTIAFFVGFPLMLLGVKLPPILQDAFSGIGSLTTYLSMIFIGMTLAMIDIRKIYKRVSMLAPAMIKMIIAPIFAALLFVKLGIHPLAIGAIVLEIAMPAQTVTSIVASEAGSDEVYAAEYIFFSTMLSLVTLPFVYYVMERIMETV